MEHERHSIFQVVAESGLLSNPASFCEHPSAKCFCPSHFLITKWKNKLVQTSKENSEEFLFVALLSHHYSLQSTFRASYVKHSLVYIQRNRQQK